MKQYLTKPLELRKKDVGIWDSIDSKCIAILDNDKSVIQKMILKYATELFKTFDEAFVVIWCFDVGLSLPIYKESFKSINLVSEGEEYLLYSLKDVSEVKDIIEYWGEYDIIDIIFPKSHQSWADFFGGQFYRKISRYSKDFIKFIANSSAIISDSGDGEEAQLILSHEVYDDLSRKKLGNSNLLHATPKH